MDKYLMIKTRDELLRINIENILYFEADRNYTKLLLSQGIMFTFAVNIGKVEEMLTKQLTEPNTTLLRVGKSFIVNKKHILQINLPKQRLLLLASEGKPRELTVPKEPLRALKDTLEAEVVSNGEKPGESIIENAGKTTSKSTSKITGKTTSKSTSEKTDEKASANADDKKKDVKPKKRG